MKKDLCQPSIDILRARCIEWFVAQGIPGPLWFPDCSDYPDAEAPKSGRRTMNVVFFGSFLTRLLESGSWKAERYRFWVLCDAARDVLTRLVGVPGHQIRTIPRYELFPASRRQRALPRSKDRFTLVFAGRLSPAKNIETLLRTVSFLQTEQRMPVKLALFGRFDDVRHIDRYYPPLDHDFDHRERVLGCLEGLEWEARPTVQEDCGPDEWFRQKIENPVLVSLSTFLSEDFGVSVAQAQALGWPCLLTDWGAYRDVRGPGVAWLPTSLVADHESGALMTLKARQLAFAIREALDAPRSVRRAQNRVPVRRTRATLPTLVRKTELGAFRRQLAAQLGKKTHRTWLKKIRRVKYEREGALLFSRYRQLFAGSAPSGECIVLVHHFTEGNNAHPVLKHVPLACRLIMDAALGAGLPVAFPYAKELFHADKLSSLLGARQVILPFFAEDLLPLARFLVRRLPLHVPLTVLAPTSKALAGKRTRAALDQLRSELKPTDHVLEFTGDRELAAAIRAHVGAGTPPFFDASQGAQR